MDTKSSNCSDKKWDQAIRPLVDIVFSCGTSIGKYFQEAFRKTYIRALLRYKSTDELKSVTMGSTFVVEELTIMMQVTVRNLGELNPQFYTC